MPIPFKTRVARPSFYVNLSILFVGVSLLLLFAAPLIAPFGVAEQFENGLTEIGAPRAPGDGFVLGTDLLGRDLLTRVIYGARTSLFIGLVANGVAVLIGTLIGMTAAYRRGIVGNLLMRFTDLMMSFPSLILAITLAAILKPSIWIVALVIALVNWVQVARVIYSESISLMEKEYIYAERCMGAGHLRIIFYHLLPYLVPTMIVWATLGVSTSVMYEATLSYLGVGVQPPVPSWGNIIYENQTYFQTAPWLIFFPGIAIILVSVSFNVLGDYLRVILDPSQMEK